MQPCCERKAREEKTCATANKITIEVSRMALMSLSARPHLSLITSLYTAQCEGSPVMRERCGLADKDSALQPGYSYRMLDWQQIG